MATRGVPDTYVHHRACSPRALGVRTYISGRPLMPMLQILNQWWI